MFRDLKPAAPHANPSAPMKKPMSGGSGRGMVSLPRALSKLGYCSRAAAERLVAAGRVAVNGATRTDSTLRVDPRRDRIAVDGRRVEPEGPVYLMLNKPRGIVTSASDEQGRETVYSLLSEADLPWVAPIGRLDRASEGLLLLSNDTRWGARVADPATSIEKVYHVQIDRVADAALLAAMEGAGELAARRARPLRAGSRNSWVEVTLDEGKNRQIRRLLEGLGVSVLRLVRVSIGPLDLGELPKGAHRPLTAAEKRAMDEALGGG